MSEAERLEEDLRDFLHEEFGLPRDFPRDEELLTMGLITSVEVAHIATFIERRANISIPDQDIGARFFDSIALIIEYVERRRD